ncbi:MAG: hypothetical protein OHK0011_19240 [Turneriella sp.]
MEIPKTIQRSNSPMMKHKLRVIHEPVQTKIAQQGQQKKSAHRVPPVLQSPNRKGENCFAKQQQVKGVFPEPYKA